MVVSFCPEYEKPHRSTGRMSRDIVDASIHRVISDLSLLISRKYRHRTIAAGDLTVGHGRQTQAMSWEIVADGSQDGENDHE